MLFTTLSNMAEDLASVPHPSLRRQRLRRYLTPRVLVIDEIGYTKLTTEQSQSFFELVRDRYEKGPIILTSNTSFSEWGKLLNELSTAEYLTLRGGIRRSHDYRSNSSPVWAKAPMSFHTRSSEQNTCDSASAHRKTPLCSSVGD